jgi:hypothetical protein
MRNLILRQGLWEYGCSIKYLNFRGAEGAVPAWESSLQDMTLDSCMSVLWVALKALLSEACDQGWCGNTSKPRDVLGDALFGPVFFSPLRKIKLSTRLSSGPGIAQSV